MSSKFRFWRLMTVAGGCLCLCAVGMAQEQQPSGGTPPKPPAKAYGPIGVEGQPDEEQTPDTIQPDTRPLTGFQQPTVGSPIERHSYWVPGVSYYNFIQSNGQYQGGGNGWISSNYLSGNISLLENWSRSQLALNYTGGGDFSTDSKIGNQWFQQVGANQTFNWERLQLVLLDEFAYLPQAQFGFGGGTGLGLPGVGGSLGGGVSGLSPGLSPGTSIFASAGPHYTNTGGVQINYALTPRSSITVGGLYGTLRYRDAGNVESDNAVGNIGYNYQISRNNTLGIRYRYNSFHFLGQPQAIGDHTVEAVFGRKITGRLALQLSGGPEITHFRRPLTGSTKTQYVAGSGGASLSYAYPRSGVSLAYFHGVTAGSGVFLGATTDQVTGTATRKLTRVWTGDVHVGFARNRNAETAHGVSNTDYNTVFAGGLLGRPLGRNANFTLGYTAYVQNASATVCAGTSCSSTFTTHQISVGLSWHTRPLVLR